MPIYVYETITASGDGECFEVLQSLRDEPLHHHPETGEAVRRVVSAPGRIATRGLKRSAKVDKSSAAATPCGCASSAALAVATRNSGFLGSGAATPQRHSHGHGQCNGHGHAHGHHDHSHHHAKSSKTAEEAKS